MALGVNIVSEFDAKGINKAIRDFKSLKTGADKAAFGLKTTTSAVNNGIKNLAKFGGVAAVAVGIIGKNLVDAGSDLEESISKVRVVFGESAGVVEDFAKKAASSMGISNQQALEAAGTYGNLLQAFGTTREQATKMSTTMVQLAGDLASFNNVPIGEALNAIRSGLSGEAEPLKRFGVAINDVRLKEEALRLGLYKGTGQLSVLAKSQAAYSLILKDTSLAQGDYGRTSDGVANRQRTLTATFEDIKAKLGTGLLPIYKSILSYTQEKLMPVFEEFTKIIGTDGLGGAFKYLGGKALDGIGSLKGWGALIYGIVTAVIALNVATGIYNALSIVSTIVTAAFGVTLNAAFMGIPALIGLVIVVFVALLLKFKALRDVAIPVLKTVANAFLAVFVNPIINAINVLITAWNLLPFHKDVAKIDEFNISMDKTAKKVETVGQEMAKLKGGLKLGQASVPLPKVKPTGGGGGGTTDTGGSSIDKMKEKLKTYTDQLFKASTAQRDLTAAIKNTSEANDRLGEANTALGIAQEKFNKVSKGYGANSKEAAQATKDLTAAQRDAVKSGYALKDAQNAVVTAQKKLQDLLKPASARSLQEATDDLTQANFNVTDAQDELTKAQTEGKPREIIEAQIKLRDAMNDASDAQQKLTDLQKAADPAEIIQAQDDLVIAEMGVAEALDAQKTATDNVNTAQKILNETINGFPATSQEYIDSLADLKQAQKDQVTAIDAVADAKYREFEATKALTQANLLLAKSKTKLTKKQIAAAEKEAESLIYKPEVTPTVSVVPTIDVSTFDFSGMDFSGIDFSGINFGMGGFTPFAEGGIVRSPVNALVGEAGPEAIIPLDRLNSFGGGDTYYIEINSKIADNTLPDLLVAELRKFNRRSGAIDIQVT